MKAKRSPRWPATTFDVRLFMCRAMLHIHGCLTDAENAKVARRIQRVLITPLPGRKGGEANGQ